jgi:hypothetical protein
MKYGFHPEAREEYVAAIERYQQINPPLAAAFVQGTQGRTIARACSRIGSVPFLDRYGLFSMFFEGVFLSALPELPW